MLLSKDNFPNKIYLIASHMSFFIEFTSFAQEIFYSLPTHTFFLFIHPQHDVKSPQDLNLSLIVTQTKLFQLCKSSCFLPQSQYILFAIPQIKKASCILVFSSILTKFSRFSKNISCDNVKLATSFTSARQSNFGHKYLFTISLHHTS